MLGWPRGVELQGLSNACHAPNDRVVVDRHRSISGSCFVVVLVCLLALLAFAGVEIFAGVHSRQTVELQVQDFAD